MADDYKGIHYAPLEKHFDRILTPFEDFIHRQTTSGILLIVTTLLALVIANSGMQADYQHITHLPIGLTVGNWSLQYSLQHWVNDGLMALFFFVVGLELKREILLGELASPRKAALPIIAAIGGMLMPALIYYMFNPTGPTAHGWGIPMATDIAFAVGILALLSARIPKQLVTFLVALAIVDDLGAVLVIAIFYTATLDVLALAAAASIVMMLVGLNAAGVRRITPYFLLALPLWYALLLSGVHPTLAGVLGAFTIPAHPKYEPRYFSQRIRDLMTKFDKCLEQDARLTSNEELRALVHAVKKNTHKVMAPLQQLEHAWHLPVAFLVIPVFAAVNAGVPLDFSGGLANSLNSPVLQGIVSGLVAGKFIGIFGFSWLAVKCGLAALPDGTNFRQIAGVALLGGIGFTMSIFIAQLSFINDEQLVLEAKLGILLASLIAGVSGFLWLWLLGLKKAA